MMNAPDMSSYRSSSWTEPGDGALGRIADFTLGTAVVLWHLALAGRDRRRQRGPVRRWSSTR